MKVFRCNLDMSDKFTTDPEIVPFGLPQLLSAQSVGRDVSDIHGTCDLFKRDEISISSNKNFVEWSFSRLCGLEMSGNNSEKSLGSSESDIFRSRQKESSVLLTAKHLSNDSVFNDMMNSETDLHSTDIRYPNSSKVLDGTWTGRPLLNDPADDQFQSTPLLSSDSVQSLGNLYNVASSRDFDNVDESGSFVARIDLIKAASQSSSNDGCYTLFGDDSSDCQFGGSPPKADSLFGCSPPQVDSHFGGSPLHTYSRFGSSPPQHESRFGGSPPRSEAGSTIQSEKSYSLWGLRSDENPDELRSTKYSLWGNNMDHDSKMAPHKPHVSTADGECSIDYRCIRSHSQASPQHDDSWYHLRNMDSTIKRNLNESTTWSRSSQDDETRPRSRVEKQPGVTMGQQSPLVLDHVTPVGTLSAEQRFFISELERLPPLLRQQYLEFMTAKQQPLAATTLPYQYLCQVQPFGPFNHVDFSLPGSMQPVMLMPKPLPSSYDIPLPMFAAPLRTQMTTKPVKRVGPANDLHIKLEECYEQFKLAENERKKTEAELARHNPGKKISSDNNYLVPQLPHNPSRIDRLVVDSLREHARVVKLAERMVDLRNVGLPQFIADCLGKWKEGSILVESCRREEIINAINRHRAKNVFSAQKDSDVLALASALGNLAAYIRDARAAIWCMLQLASNDLPEKSVEFANQIAVNRVAGEDCVALTAASAKFATLEAGIQVQMLEYMNCFKVDVEGVRGDADGSQA